MNMLYTTRATSNLGREGKVESEDKRLSVKLTPPKELGGSGEGTDPEQLFAAGYAACFANAIIFIARERKVRITGTSVTTEVSLGRNDDGSFGLKVGLQASIEGVSDEAADSLIAEADRCCPYSNAIRGNVDKTLVRI